MLELFDGSARLLLVRAADAARELGSPLIEIEHVLLAYTTTRDLHTVALLETAGVDFDALRSLLHKALPATGTASPGHMPFSEDVRRILQQAPEEAKLAGYDKVRDDHILLAIISTDLPDTSVAAQVLRELGVGALPVRGTRTLARIFHGYVALDAFARQVADNQSVLVDDALVYPTADEARSAVQGEPPAALHRVSFALTAGEYFVITVDGFHATRHGSFLGYESARRAAEKHGSPQAGVAVMSPDARAVTALNDHGTEVTVGHACQWRIRRINLLMPEAQTAG